MSEAEPKYDVFISHASEDKEEVAIPLADYLIRHGLRVWLDTFELTIGDSLRRSIDKGLSESRFGLVILSPNFFKKEWPQRELDGLVAREDGKEKVILPIWHKISREEIVRFSPTLAGKLAASTANGMEYVAQQVLLAVQRAIPESQTRPILSNIEDRIATDLAQLRTQLITSSSSYELRRTLYDVESFLARYPNYTDGRLLKHQIEMALQRAERPPIGSRPRSLRLEWSLVLLWIAIGAVGVIGFIILRWFLR
jgi:hypothetical protein